MQFTRPEMALQYEEALRSSGVSSIDPVIREMGAGDAPALEIGEFEVNRGTRLMILGFSRPQLVRCTSIDLTIYSKRLERFAANKRLFNPAAQQEVLPGW